MDHHNRNSIAFHPPGLSRRAQTNADLHAKLAQMRLPLAPLVQLTTGATHPSFPPTLLSFWLLTEPELESLAHFYHQRTPCDWTWRYPCPVAWPAGLSLEQKRRRIGRFIGLRGCESPVVVGQMQMQQVLVRSEEEVEEEARRARLAEEEESRRKRRWY